MTGYWYEVDHTADLAIAVYGSDQESLFSTAAQALMSLACHAEESETSLQFTVNLSAPDIETLLVDWLNELLYLSERHNVCFSKFTFQRLSTCDLKATLMGTGIAAPKQYIKAATFHNIAVIQRGDGLHTEIVFDL
jgi:SHS2 domain-containing protein